MKLWLIFQLCMVLLKCNVALAHAHQLQMPQQSLIKGAWHLVCLWVSILRGMRLILQAKWVPRPLNHRLFKHSRACDITFEWYHSGLWRTFLWRILYTTYKLYKVMDNFWSRSSQYYFWHSPLELVKWHLDCMACESSKH